MTAQSDMLDIIRLLCKCRDNIEGDKCKGCNNEWLCTQVHGPAPDMWPKPDYGVDQ